MKWKWVCEKCGLETLRGVSPELLRASPQMKRPTCAAPDCGGPLAAVDAPAVHEKDLRGLTKQEAGVLAMVKAGKATIKASDWAGRGPVPGLRPAFVANCLRSLESRFGLIRWDAEAGRYVEVTNG
ncbi:MAG: hypothetical protein U0990_09410 [Candidatus Nanopelagicales bacterium]|nr:hypothetical protein [Candidatus Nanopelagicales bacterium]